MPTITLPGMTFGSAEPLLSSSKITSVKDNYTKRIHQPKQSGAVSDYGIMSAINGQLDAVNLGDYAFRISQRHIMPEQAALARMGAVRDTGAIYGSSVGGLRGDDTDTKWVNLAGTSVRWYQPYDATVALLEWSVFMSHNNWMGRFVDGEGVARGVSGETTLDNRNVVSRTSDVERTFMLIRGVLDGEAINNSSRYLGENMFHPVAPGERPNTEHTGPGLEPYSSYFDPVKPTYPTKGGNPKYVWGEAHSAVPFSMHHLTSLSKGFHEISLEAYFLNTSGTAPVFVQNMGNRSRAKNVRARGYFNLTPKLCLGIRNSRVVSFL